MLASRTSDKVRSDPNPEPDDVRDGELRSHCAQLKLENSVVCARLDPFAVTTENNPQEEVDSTILCYDAVACSPLP